MRDKLHISKYIKKRGILHCIPLHIYYKKRSILYKTYFLMLEL